MMADFFNKKKYLNIYKYINEWASSQKHKQLLMLSLSLLFVMTLLLGFAYFLESKTETWMHELEMEELSSQADTVAGFLDLMGTTTTQENISQYIAKLGRDPNFRITVLGISGDVLADSWLGLDAVKVVKNMANRPEVSQSSLHSVGTSIRYSNVISKKLVYVARRYQKDNFSGYVRIATPSTIVATDLKELHQDLMQGVFIIFFVFCGFAIYVHKQIKHAQYLDNQQKETLSHLDKQSRQSESIQKFGQVLTTCESRDELVNIISNMGSHLFGEDTFGALAVSPPSLDTIEIIATWGKHWPGEKRFHPKDCWGFRRGGVHLSKRSGMDISCSHLELKNSDAVQCVLLQSLGVSLGALHIGASEETFNSSSFQTKIYAITEQLCLTISNLNLRVKLEQQAIRDPLTALYNRRYLDDSFVRELKRAERKETSLGVIMIDIDHFKVFNDTYGHDAGDHVIKEFGHLLSQTVRAEDISCRYGGEEFTLVLNEIDMKSVVKRAEALLEATRNLQLELNGQSLGQITVSLGIAMFPQHGSTQQELIKAADQALYRAKKAGRNQLKVVHGTVIPASKAA